MAEGNSKDEQEAAEIVADRLAFLSALSHELRTPLNTIGGFSEIMAEQMLGPLENPKYQEYVRDIRKSTAELRAIIEDSLKIPMLESAIRRGGSVERQLIDLSPDLICAFRDEKIVDLHGRSSLSLYLRDCNSGTRYWLTIYLSSSSLGSIQPMLPSLRR